jgi:hypothetical protein
VTPFPFPEGHETETDLLKKTRKIPLFGVKIREVFNINIQIQSGITMLATSNTD